MTSKPFLFSLLASILLNHASFSQEPVIQIQPRANIASNIYSSFVTDSVKMEVILKKKVIYTAYCDSLGRFPYYDLPLNKTFYAKFSKPGFVGKIAEINTGCPKGVHLPSSTPLLLQVSLIHAVRGKDYSFTETEPMIKFYFGEKGTMTFDLEYVKGMQARVDAVTNAPKQE